MKKDGLKTPKSSSTGVNEEFIKIPLGLARDVGWGTDSHFKLLERDEKLGFRYIIQSLEKPHVWSPLMDSKGAAQCFVGFRGDFTTSKCFTVSPSAIRYRSSRWRLWLVQVCVQNNSNDLCQ